MNSNRKKKRIGILTWFNSGYNAGQTLQAFSLQRYLEKCNYGEVEVVCYDTSLIPKDEYDYFSNKLEQVRGSVLEAKAIGYNRFIMDNIKLTEACSRRYELFPLLCEKKYDVLISGSDQIWNPTIYDPAFYFDCVASKKDIIRIKHYFRKKNGRL